MLSSTEYCAV